MSHEEEDHFASGGRTVPPDANHEEEVAALVRLGGPRPAVGSERTDRVKGAVHARWREEIRSRRRRRFFGWVAVPAFAVVLVAVAVGVFRYLARGSSPGPSGPVATVERSSGPLQRGDSGSVAPGAGLDVGTVISTGVGGRAALRLGHGASLRLDSDTSLRLLSREEVGLDRGALYIDSGGAQEGSLAVHTPTGIVRDVGTQFEVRLQSGDLRVTVREGSASVGLSGGEVAIHAGTRLIATPSGEISRTAVLAHDPDWSWTLEVAPPIPLEGQTLGAFLDWVSRETGRRIRFADAETERKRDSTVLHGSLGDLHPDEAPAAILPTCGLTAHQEGDVLIIEPLDASRTSP